MIRRKQTAEKAALPMDWRRGMVLVLVLIVVAMLSLAGFSFSELMFIEHKGARLAGRQLQVRTPGAVPHILEERKWLSFVRRLRSAVCPDISHHFESLCTR